MRHLCHSIEGKRVKKIRLLPLLLGLLIVSACANQPQPTAIPAKVVAMPTANLCAPENVKTTAGELHQFMRAFDDAYQLAAILPRTQVAPQVSKLQDIRRAAQDYVAPACLTHLKESQILHMNTTINTFLAFLSGADTERVNQGLALARQQHDAYVLELAQLIGATVVVLPSVTTVAQAPTAETPSPIVIVNPNDSPINLYAFASMTSALVGALEAGQSAIAVGRSSAGEWVLIEFPDKPGQTFWVYTSFIQFTAGDLESLPIVDNSAP